MAWRDNILSVHGGFEIGRKILLTSVGTLIRSQSERVNPIALAEDKEKLRFLLSIKRRAASSKAIKFIGNKFEIIRRDSLWAVLYERVMHLVIWYWAFLSLLMHHFLLRQWLQTETP